MASRTTIDSNGLPQFGRIAASVSGVDEPNQLVVTGRNDSGVNIPGIFESFGVLIAVAIANLILRPVAGQRAVVCVEEYPAWPLAIAFTTLRFVVEVK